MAEKHHQSHTFVANMFGAAGYVATVFVWLLVLEVIVMLLPTPVTTTINTVSTTTVSPIGVTSDVSADPLAAIRFLLVVALAVAAWVFCYFVARISSRILRRFLRLYGRKVSLGALLVVKYLWMTIGLIGVVILLQYVTDDGSGVHFAVSFLALVAGVLGIGAIWLQSLLAKRHKIAVAHLL